MSPDELCRILKTIGNRRQNENFPWRRTEDPYQIFLAELLLIRTRAEAVALIFDRVIEKFPDLKALAEAEEKELEEVLRPLGLKKRVPLLKRAASFVLEQYGGKFPSDETLLKKIPGMGEYTAKAFRVFAFRSRDLPPDVNIFRLLSRITGTATDHPTKGSKKLRELVGEISEICGNLSPPAVLDFARTVCRPRNPRCDSCAIRNFCRYYLTNRNTK